MDEDASDLASRIGERCAHLRKLAVDAELHVLAHILAVAELEASKHRKVPQRDGKDGH